MSSVSSVSSAADHKRLLRWAEATAETDSVEGVRFGERFECALRDIRDARTSDTLRAKADSRVAVRSFCIRYEMHLHQLSVLRVVM